MDLRYGVSSFADLAKIAICGWFTQLGTRISWRIGSYVTAAVLPKFTPRFDSSALRMIRRGATSPLAINGYTVAVELPRLETQTSWFLRSIAMPVGFRRRVEGPLITRIGATSPWAIEALANTRMDLPMSLATYRSPLSGLNFIAAGQLSWVLSPVMTRSGFASPFASME